MTIAAGFIGDHGAVLCADSQETIGGYAVKKVEKISVNECKAFNLAVVGAGHAPYIDMISTDIYIAVYGCDGNPVTIEEAVSKVLIEFHTKHIWPRSPDPNLAPLEFLILISDRKYADDFLFHTCDTAINWIQGSKAIGVGSYLADYILENMLTNDGTEEHLLATAVYMLKEVRENISGCGMESSIYFFGRNGIYQRMDENAIAVMEKNCEHFKAMVKAGFYEMTESESAPRKRKLDIAAELVRLQEHQKIANSYRDNSKKKAG